MRGCRHMLVPILCVVCAGCCACVFASDSHTFRNRFAIMSLSRACFVCWLGAANATAVAGTGGDLPVVDVSLSPEASPALSGAIADADAARGRFQASVVEAEMRAFRVALEAAEPRIDAAAKRAVRALSAANTRPAASGAGFLASGAQGDRASFGGDIVEVEVPVERPFDVSAAAAFALRGSEVKRANVSADAAETALADFGMLTDFVIGQIDAAVAAQAFGASHVVTSFVDVSESDGPVAAAVARLAERQVAGDELVRAKHLALSMALLRRENELLRAALRREVAESQSAPVAFLGATASAATAGPAQVAINLLPPVEDAADTVARIDEVMSAERAKQAAANLRFASEKRHALETMKLELRQAVRDSMR